MKVRLKRDDRGERIKLLVNVDFSNSYFSVFTFFGALFYVCVCMYVSYIAIANDVLIITTWSLWAAVSLISLKIVDECSKRISLCNHVTYVIGIRMLRDVCLFQNKIGRWKSSDSSLSTAPPENDGQKSKIEFSYHQNEKQNKKIKIFYYDSHVWIRENSSASRTYRIIRIFAAINRMFLLEWIYYWQSQYVSIVSSRLHVLLSNTRLMHATHYIADAAVWCFVSTVTNNKHTKLKCAIIMIIFFLITLNSKNDPFIRWFVCIFLFTNAL